MLKNNNQINTVMRLKTNLGEPLREQNSIDNVTDGQIEKWSKISFQFSASCFLQQRSISLSAWSCSTK